MEEPQKFQKRNVAKKINISDINEAEYMKENGQTLNFLSTKIGEVSRVNIMGVIVSKADGSVYSDMVIDDSTGTINLRSFEQNEMMNILSVGDLVQLIGRPREYDGKKYVLTEVVKKIENPKWAIVRRKELALTKDFETKQNIEIKKENKEELKPQIIQPIIPLDNNKTISMNTYEVILNLIKSLDTGFGVPFEEIILNSKIKDCEDIIKTLIEEGEVFEVRPGILKSM